MYVFYESYRYKSTSTTSRTKTIITQMITVWENPRQSFVALMQKKYGTKHCTYEKGSRKLYLRQRARKTAVYWWRDKRGREPDELIYFYVENYILDISMGVFPGEN